MNARDTALLQEFHASYSLEDQRRVVSLTRKGNTPLPSNRLNAEQLFRRLEQTLKRNIALRHVYHEHMLHYIKKGKWKSLLLKRERQTSYIYSIMP
jgi:predicted signal transduction protein with EAL and GGDEF domain